MSTVTEDLTAQRTELLLQRSAAKDRIEQLDLGIGQLTFALEALKEQNKRDNEGAKDIDPTE